MSESKDVFRAPYGTRDVLAPESDRWAELVARFAGSPYFSDVRALRGEAEIAPALDSMDVIAVLQPILGIRDVTTDKRIDFVGGARGTNALAKLVDSGKAAVAFSLYPVSLSDLMAVSDAGAIMPPKSTWFEPKLRDGLLSHLI